MFFEPEAKKSGVYLWTTPYEGKYLAHYVGETGKTFVERFAEHTRNVISGFWSIFDPVDFVKGHRKYVWEGWWKRPELKDPTRTMDFLENYFELTKTAYDYLGVIQIFLIPIPGSDERTRKRVETSIAVKLFDQGGITKDFQDEYCFSSKNPQNYRRYGRKPRESEIKVSIKSYEIIYGLEAKLDA